MFPAVLRVPQPYAYRSGRSPDEEVDYCVGELRDAIDRRATGLPPALIMEPVQGNGTQLDFPDRYYREVQPGLRRARHPADLRRGADRVRPDRQDVGRRVLRRDARPAGLRQGRGRRLPAGRGAGQLGPGPGSSPATTR